MGLPLTASHSRAVLSTEAVTTRWPSGLNCAETTPSAWIIGVPTDLPVIASQSRAVLSSEAVTTSRPSGLNCADVTRSHASWVPQLLRRSRHPIAAPSYLLRRSLSAGHRD